MNRRTPHLAIIGLLSAFATTLVILTWRDAPPPLPDTAAVVPVADAVLRHEPIAPLPARPPESGDARVRLGEMLFHERMLSRDNSISCASCHRLDNGGVDGLPFSPGVDGAIGVINTPTVLNAAFSFMQFWDGRAPTLEAQVAGPIHNPIEMASTWSEVIAKLSRREDYRAAFANAYPQGITPETISDAIARFERTLTTPDAPFDRYLRGDTKALNAEEREGYARFKNLGCSSCHQGVNIGGNFFQRFGVLGDYFADRGNITTADLGRFNVTGDEADRHVFKVPSLRNVALTAPYFHDAGADTLEDAVSIMGRYQLGRTLSDEDVRLIVAFLHTLTGKAPGGGGAR
ncbi:cytochrome-c peroxidase [Pseudothauera lacus]|uniref:Cytochrome B6 n=1 Tax=Pseudothauera lacus TaxID=2136175 RepID=A0A2T4IHB4_9RHOO|nr:cytochrome-c peroxidase [Pseudothauera lacus]PTD97106.1 cytochrome B6 [Pseudothauera lacus]